MGDFLGYVEAVIPALFGFLVGQWLAYWRVERHIEALIKVESDSP